MWERARPLLTFRKRTTASQITWVVESIILPRIGDVDIGAADVQQFIAGLAGRYSAQTLHHVAHTFSFLFRAAGVRDRLDLMLPELVSRQRVALLPEQVARLADEVGEPAATLIRFLAVTGLRIGEALGLKIRDINPSDDPKVDDGVVIPPRSIIVRRAYVVVRGKGAYQTLKGRGNRGRIIPLPDGMLVPSGDPDAPVFAGRTGRPLNANNLLVREVKPACERLGLPSISWHDLRHTAATWADLEGMPSATKRAMFGWETTRMEYRYSHPNLDAARQVSDRLYRRLRTSS